MSILVSGSSAHQSAQHTHTGAMRSVSIMSGPPVTTSSSPTRAYDQHARNAVVATSASAASSACVSDSAHVDAQAPRVRSKWTNFVAGGAGGMAGAILTMPLEVSITR